MTDGRRHHDRQFRLRRGWWSAGAVLCGAVLMLGPAPAAFGDGSPMAIAVVSGGGQSAAVGSAFAEPLVAQVTDGSGDPVPGVTVTFSAPGADPTGNFSGSSEASVTTDGDGLATAPTFSAGDVAGNYQVLATADGAPTPAAFDATDTAGAPVGIAVVSGDGQSASVGGAFAAPFVAQVTDGFGNPVPGVTVTFSAPGADPTGNFSGSSEVSVTTDGDGLATAPAFSAGDVAGSYQVLASADGVPTPAAFDATDTAGAPVGIAVISGDGQSASVGGAFAAPFVAQVTDGFGNPVPGVTVTFSAPGAGPTGNFSGSPQASVTTDADGLATAPAFSAGHVPGSYQVLASADGVATPAVFGATDTAGSPMAITVVSGDGQSATVVSAFAVPFVAQVTDGFGNPVPGVTVTFSAPGAGPTGNFSGSPQATVTTDADGLATAPTISAGDVAGSYQVLATADGVATPAAFEATDTAGAPVGIAAVSGGGQSAKVGSPYAEPFVAQVTDQFGNPVPGVTVTFSAPGADPTGNFSGRPQASVTTDADGLATAPTFSAGDVVGTYEVVASTEGVVILATFGATDTAGTPAAIAVVSGDGQSATVGTAFADLFVAEVTDEFGNPVPGVVVTFRAPGTNPTGTFSGSSQASVTTDAAGLATTPTFMAGELAGSYQVLATAAGVATPAAFDATDAAGAPADVAIVSGDGQSGVREYTFASPLTVVVRDRFGNPVPGVAVTFNAPAHKATAKFDGEHTALVPTNAAGLAISPTVTAGTVIGSYNVSASVSPTVTPGEFTLSNVAGSDLRVSEKAQSGPAPGTASIVLTARNGGPNGDTNVVITDVVTTPGLKLLKPNSNVCTVAGNTVTCHRPTFGRQGVFVIVIAVTGISGDPVSAHGSITGALPDPVLSNNQVTASTTIL